MLAHTPSRFFFWQAGKGPYLITIPIRPPPHSSFFCLCSCPSFCCYWTGIALANATATAPAALAVSAAADSVAAVIVTVAATVVDVTARVTAASVAAAESSSAVVAVAETAPASASRVAVAAVATVAGAWPLGLGRDLRLSTQATILRFSLSRLRVSIYSSQSHETIRSKEWQIEFITMTCMA